jgi:RNA polymerase sigma-70 factor (ECF subfamily)
LHGERRFSSGNLISKPSAFILEIRVNLPSEREDKLSALMKKAQEGDQIAYQSLLEECAVMIWEFAMRRLSKSDSTEDVAQETLMSIHRARHTYDPSRPFTPWMYAIAQH